VPSPTISDIYKRVVRAAVLSLLLNLVLGAAKLIGGMVSGSFALIADSINSLGDVVSTIVVLVALHVAQRPADKEHPYGHTRAEAIAASNVAVLIIVSAVLVMGEALSRITEQHGIPPAWTLWIAGCNIVIKEALFWYNRSVGRRTGSAAIIANAWDHRSDALCALAVLAGLATIRIGGPTFIWADEAASIIVAVAIAFSGIQLFINSSNELMDLQADPEMLRAMTAEALQVEGVKDVETLWVRKSGLEYFADIHIEVEAQMSIEQGHRIGHQVKSRLAERFITLRDVLVHLEPSTL
jgi:cation diffusion facilitator family transporter